MGIDDASVSLSGRGWGGVKHSVAAPGGEGGGEGGLGCGLFPYRYTETRNQGRNQGLTQQHKLSLR